MTKDEFIDEWLSDLPRDTYRRALDGVMMGESYRVVLPCACGESLCKGWAFIRPDEVSEWNANGQISSEPEK